MSPPWAETVRVLVGADEVRVARLRAGWPRWAWRPTAAPLKGLAGQGAAPLASRAELGTALAAALQSCGAARGTPVQVLLSSAWVHLQLATQAAALAGRAELNAAARHALQRVYGDSAAQWCIRADRCGRDALLCAGVEQSLLNDVARVCSGVGLPLAACGAQPVRAWNQVRQRLPANGWLVLLEAGHGTLVCIEKHEPKVLLRQRLPSASQGEPLGPQRPPGPQGVATGAADPPCDLAADLARWRQRCQLQHAAGDPAAPCLVVACDWPAATVPGATLVHLSSLQ